MQTKATVGGEPVTMCTYMSEGIPLQTNRPRLTILGTGWAAARLLRDINPKLYDLTVGGGTRYVADTGDSNC